MKDLPPAYATYRGRLLKFAHRFASLDEATRERFADPRSRYRSVVGFALNGWPVANDACSFGWSHGKVST